MGGPSPESYRAAKAALERRLAARRTRDGVVDLAEWRLARRAAWAIHGLLHDPPWLLGVRVAVTRPVGLEVVVTVLRDDREILMCLPRSVDDVPVRVVARNPRTGRNGGG